MTGQLNLQKRPNGVYYLRLYVPTDLLSQFGCSEITRSIGTKRKGEAERAIPILKNVWSRLITMARQTPTLSSDDLKEMAKRYFDSALEEADQERIGRRVSSSEKQKLIDSYAEMHGMLQQWLKKGEVDLGPKYSEQLLKGEGIELDPASDEYKELAKLAMKAQVDIHGIMHDRIVDSLTPSTPVNSYSAAIPSEAHSSASVSLKTVSDEFRKEHAAVWASKTVGKNRANLSVCMELLGSGTPVNSIGKAEIRTLKESLSKLPPNWKKRHKSKSILEVLEGTPKAAKVISPTTINSYLGTLSSMFSWAQNNGYVETNPVTGIRALDPVRAQDKRSPFNIDQLQLIFNAPIYTGIKSARKWKEPGSTIIKNERYWLPLLALFTGMRLGELVAIKASDISEADGIYSISIPKAKTEAGIRTMPVHPTLIDLGLVDYISTLEPSSPLFLGATQKSYSKFFRRFTDSLGLSDPKLVFHSFRHTFADALRAAQVQEPIAKALLGHSDSSVTGQYGSGYPIQVLYEAIKTINYNGLDVGFLISPL